MNRARKPSTNVAALVLLVGLASVAGWFAAVRFTGGEAPEHAVVLPAARPLPEFSLLDQDGNTFTQADFSGQWSILFFGFTHCPDVCPATLQIMAAARDQLQAQALDTPRLVLISVDPDRDTVEVMQRYTGHFGDDVLGLTGELDELQKLTRALGIYFEIDDQSADTANYNVSHSAHVLVLNADGDYVGLFSAPHSVDAFVMDLPRMMGAR